MQLSPHSWSIDYPCRSIAPFVLLGSCLNDLHTTYLFIYISLLFKIINYIWKMFIYGHTYTAVVDMTHMMRHIVLQKDIQLTR